MPQKPNTAKKDNPKAFKHWIGRDLLIRISESLSVADPSFDKKQFLSLSNQLTPLELKPRVQLVRDQLYKQLPKDFPKAVQILLGSLEANKLKGFDLWPYTEFIQTYGLNHLKVSLNALKILTTLFTSEFAIRPFINKHPKETLEFLKKCSRDKNPHVRRWASEGSRPRLPWGEKLQMVIKNPHLTLPILEQLKSDPELYVRKSVCNHLNDFSKDHPELVVKTLKAWQDLSSAEDKVRINWILHRSLRTLIKNGHSGALKLIGVSNSLVKVSPLKLNKNTFKINEKLEFEFTVISESKKSQKLVIDYIVHYQKSNKSTSPKVFKMKTLNLPPLSKIQLKKSHHLKEVTTRKHYSGEHFIEIQINGKVHSKSKWKLSL